MTTEIATGDGLYDVPDLPAAPDHDVPTEGPGDGTGDGPAYGPPVGIEDPFPEAADPRQPDGAAGQPTRPDGGRVQQRFSAPLPVGSRLTSGFGQREGILHAGTDWAPPTPGQRGVSVVAVADATVLAVGRNRGRRADRIPYHSGRFVWLDLGVLGGQRMRVYYGHLASVSVTEGQHLRVGQVVGVMGGSGASGEDDFPIHLHFGVAQDHDRPVPAARRHGAAGWINADAWLRSKGIRVGTTPPVAAEAASSGATTQQVTPKQQTTLQTTTGPKTSSATGPRHVRDDASIRQTAARVREVQERNLTGAYRTAGGRVADGNPGAATARMLGIAPYPG